MQVKFEIKFTELAIESYLHIGEYLIGNFGIVVFESFENKIDSLVDRISANKYLCPVSKISNLRKCTITERTSMIYRVEIDKIEIIAFVDNRSNHLY